MSSASADKAAEPHALLGSVLRGTYRLERVLDQGGMGTVFEAEHVRLGRRLAVKVLAQHLTSDSQALARFHREAAIVSHLQHPHIVQVLDYDTTEQGEPYIVMELLRGESLARKLERVGRLSIEEVVRLVDSVALGLSAAHRASVVHRDLKPANVFLAEDADRGQLVKLLDFGISLRSSTDRRLTGEYAVLGTPDYMSPEQASGRTAQVDHRADEYSLAVIAYEALSGQTPFPGTEVMEVLAQVISASPVPIQRVAPEVSSAVWAVLERALAKNPEARYTNVAEFSAALWTAAGYSLPPSMPQYAPSRAPSDASRAPSDDPPSPISSIKARPIGRYRVSTPSSEDLDEATRPTNPAPGRAQEVTRIFSQAREAFGLGDLDLAVSFAENAMQLGDTLGAEGRQAMTAEASLIESIFSTRIGDFRRRLVVRHSSSAPGGPKLRPEQAFLLSRLESEASAEEILDLSPLPRHETLRHLVAMLTKGVLGAR